MSKMIVPLILVVILAGFALQSREGGQTWNDMQYDLYRGSGSSVINEVQLRAVERCFGALELTRYKGKAVTLTVNAPNGRVAAQLRTLMEMALLQAGATTIPKPEDKPANGDFDIELSSLCGGYHDYPGLIFRNYQSTARLILAETPIGGGKARYFDSGYQNASTSKPVLNAEARLAIYALAGLLITALWRLPVAGSKRRARLSRPVAS